MRVRSRAGLRTQLLILGSVAAIATGCSSSSTASTGSPATGSGSSAFDQIVSAANAEGAVTLYTPAQQTIIDGWTSGFQKAYPKIKLSVYRASPGALQAKLAADQQAGSASADVLLSGTDGVITTLHGYDTSGKLAALVGPHFKDPEMKAAVESPNRFYVYVSVFGWAWNTDLLPKGIHSWQDLLARGLANGKVAVWDPSIAPIIPSYYMGQVAASGDPGYLQKLAAQKPGIYPGSEAMENAVASGEVAATPFATKRVLTLKAQGAPIDYAVPQKGAGVPSLEAGVLKSAAHPDAAQVLANWLASEDGQKAVLVSGVATRSNVPGNDIDFATLTPTSSVSADQQKTFVDTFNALFHK